MIPAGSDPANYIIFQFFLLKNGRFSALESTTQVPPPSNHPKYIAIYHNYRSELAPKKFSHEPDFPALLRLCLIHQFGECLDHLLEDILMFVYFALKIIELLHNLTIGQSEMPQGDKGSHDGNRSFAGNGALEDCRQHVDALLGKNLGRIFALATSASL
jgi:hypothetical protein